MKPISNFNEYFADELGNIYSFKPRNWRSKPSTIPRVLKHSKQRGGYSKVILRKDGKSFQKLVHRLVLETFVCECPEGMESCHNDGDVSNNKLSNLRWDTPKNNQADRKKHGTDKMPKGENYSHIRFTPMQIKIIRRYNEMYGRGSQAEIAKVFGASHATINNIVLRKTWGHI